MLFGFVFVCLSSLSHSDPWNEAKSKNSGNYIRTYSVTVSSSAATELVSQASAILSANADIFNNSAYVLYIGTNTTTLESAGFPILSSKTYTLDGTYTGTIYGLAEAAAAGSINVRTIYYLKNDAVR